MHERFGQLAKKIVGRALPPLGTLRVEHEIPVADAQAGDAYFEPTPGEEKAAERAHLGWLGRMVIEPCLLEMIQSTPGPRVVRSNVRKQLGLDHARALEAEKERWPEPPLLRLWMISAGRPDEVLAGYGFRRRRGWPPGFFERWRLDAVGLVVLPELPRSRDTLLLRLLGRGRVLREAIEDLKALPAGAAEFEIAYNALVALRFEVVDDEDDETRALLMDTDELIEKWRTEAEAKGMTRGLAEGRSRGLAEGMTKARIEDLVRIHEARFGPMPARMQKSLAAKVTEQTGPSWVVLFATAGSAAEIAAAIRRGAPVH